VYPQLYPQSRQNQAIALNEGMRRKKGLWSKRGRAQFESLVLAPWITRRRQDLLELLNRLDPKIDGLSSGIQQEAEQRPEVQRLMTQPGVGPITALAFVLILGVPELPPREKPARLGLDAIIGELFGDQAAFPAVFPAGLPCSAIPVSASRTG
jgi:hypothetical protein